MPVRSLFASDNSVVSGMSAPIGNTCPQIDEVIETLEACENDLEDVVQRLNALHRGRNSELEELRAANDTLRTWGESMQEENEELKKELAAAYALINDTA